MSTIEEALNSLQHSKFRSSFHLNKEMKEYVKNKGYDVIERHARDFVRDRLASAHIKNDGHQTPMKGHPVFIAQHATACCCRGCLNRWYRVPKETDLTQIQQEKIVRLIMAWIKREMENS